MAKQLPYPAMREIFARFQTAEAEPKGELEHVNAFTLVVAVALSAQATDAGVNKATRGLFAVADTPQKMLALGLDGVTEHIKTIGLFRQKAKNIIKLSQMIVDDLADLHLEAALEQAQAQTERALLNTNQKIVEYRFA